MTEENKKAEPKSSQSDGGRGLYFFIFSLFVSIGGFSIIIPQSMGYEIIPARYNDLFFIIAMLACGAGLGYGHSGKKGIIWGIAFVAGYTLIGRLF